MSASLVPGQPDREALKALGRIVAWRPDEHAAEASADDLAVAWRILWDEPPALPGQTRLAVQTCQARVTEINQWLTGALLAGFDDPNAPAAYDCPWVRWMLNLEQ